jgi:acyl carrier protein
MSNEEKLKDIFASELNLDPDKVVDSLAYQSVPTWDSVAHMRLVGVIDEQFGTMLETEDVIDMSSFAKAKEILAKYGVEMQ